MPEERTCKNFLQVQTEGSRSVWRNIPNYNLDMIITVGYRVKSQVATKFRVWATQRLTFYYKDCVFQPNDTTSRILSGYGTDNTEQIHRVISDFQLERDIIRTPAGL
ncbi:MAG: virulence RhuM family protein [Tannerella sp.]|nr:virulence RhuM family protein [Tannerella sp.]